MFNNIQSGGAIGGGCPCQTKLGQIAPHASTSGRFAFGISLQILVILRNRLGIRTALIQGIGRHEHFIGIRAIDDQDNHDKQDQKPCRGRTDPRPGQFASGAAPQPVDHRVKIAFFTRRRRLERICFAQESCEVGIVPQIADSARGYVR